jgi:hypothetical protein
MMPTVKTACHEFGREPARRQHRAIDLLHDISGLKKRGYREPEIARKTV